MGCEDSKAAGIRDGLERNLEPVRGTVEPVPPTATSYQETWVFSVKRVSGKLCCYAKGFDMVEGYFKVVLVYDNAKWDIASASGQNGSKMSPELEHEMFRQFAAHKARYLASRGTPDSPRGVSAISPLEGEPEMGDEERLLPEDCE